MNEMDEKDDGGFYLYVLKCADGSLYTGYSTNVEQRVRAHNRGAGAKYTRSHRPVRLVAQAKFQTKHDAMSAEYHFKQLSRAQKDEVLKRAQTESFESILAAL